jgi:hypothetical protein
MFCVVSPMPDPCATELHSSWVPTVLGRDGNSLGTTDDQRRADVETHSKYQAVGLDHQPRYRMEVRMEA